MIIYFIIVSSTCLSAKNKRSYLVWLLFLCQEVSSYNFLSGGGVIPGGTGEICRGSLL